MENNEWINPFFNSKMQKLLKYKIKDLAFYYPIGENQKYYSIMMSMCNEIAYSTPRDIAIDNYENQMKKVYNEELVSMINNMTEEKISFEDMFLSDNKVLLNENQIVYICYYLCKRINELLINNAVTSRKIVIYINLVKNTYSIFKDSQKIKELSINCNIIKALYEVIKEELNSYSKLSNEDKIKRILKKYKIRCDFTKRKHSYQITSNHIVLSKSIDTKKLLTYLETTNENTVITIINYFTLIMIDKERIVEALSRDIYYEREKSYLYVPKELKRNNILEAFTIPYNSYFAPIGELNYFIDDKGYLTDIDIQDFIEVFNGAKPKYLMGKLKSLKDTEITNNKYEYKFAISKQLRDRDYWHNNVIYFVICNFIQRELVPTIEIDNEMYHNNKVLDVGVVKYKIC